MQDIERNDLSEVEQNGCEFRLGGAPSLELDASEYAEELCGLEITPEQCDELLATLWSMMAGMVELGFSYDLCGQIFNGFENVTETGKDRVELPSSQRR